MAYNSFYGGRQGAPFIIVKSFSTVEEMVENFKKGIEYNIVNFDEYVVIDTISKTDLNNGKIYRRGKDFTNELGGAIYIGQVAGAPGSAPHLELTTIQDIKETTEGQEDAYRKGEGSYAPIDGNLLPGKYEEDGVIKFNDEIQWAYCSIVDENGLTGTAQIGFAFPYLVVDYEASLVEDNYEGSLFERIDDEQHPFYQKWHLNIPKGDKGTSIQELTIDTGETEGEGSQKLQVTYNDNTPIETIGNPINYIIKTEITDDYHLVALHSSPDKRAQIIAEGKNYTWDGRNDWQDLGSIKDEDGVFIGLNYDSEEIPEMSSIVTAVYFLNNQYPSGLSGDLKGKVVTAGKTDEEKTVYAFDYGLKNDGSYKGWYFLGTVDGSGGSMGAGVVVGREDDSDTQILANALPVNGVWFVIE